MITTLVENPMPIVFFGIFAEAALAAALLTTRRGVLLWAMGGVLLVVLAGLLLEWAVVTEAERVEATLDCLAAALEANDLDEVMRYIAPEARPSISRARYAMNLFVVTEARVKNLNVTINRLTSPPSAKARFIGAVSVKDRKGNFPYQTTRIGFDVTFRLEGDRWLVTGHKEGDPRKFL